MKKVIWMDSGMVPDRESIVLIRWSDDNLIKSIDESKFLDEFVGCGWFPVKHTVLENPLK